MYEILFYFEMRETTCNSCCMSVRSIFFSLKCKKFKANCLNCKYAILLYLGLITLLLSLQFNLIIHLS